MRAERIVEIYCESVCFYWARKLSFQAMFTVIYSFLLIPSGRIKASLKRPGVNAEKTVQFYVFHSKYFHISFAFLDVRLYSDWKSFINFRHWKQEKKLLLSTILWWNHETVLGLRVKYSNVPFIILFIWRLKYSCLCVLIFRQSPLLCQTLKTSLVFGHLFDLKFNLKSHVTWNRLARAYCITVTAIFSNIKMENHTNVEGHSNSFVCLSFVWAQFFNLLNQSSWNNPKV